MKPYVNAFKVIELSDWDLQTIKELGFRGIRFDLQSTSEVEASCEKLLEYDLEGLMLINGGGMPLTPDETVLLAEGAASLAAGNIAFEIGNEPDISPVYADDWDGFGKLVNDAAIAVSGTFPGREWRDLLERGPRPRVSGLRHALDGLEHPYRPAFVPAERLSAEAAPAVAFP